MFVNNHLDCRFYASHKFAIGLAFFFYYIRRCIAKKKLGGLANKFASAPFMTTPRDAPDRIRD